MSLTAKQEKFCQAVARGMNHSDAYRHAYNVGKMKATGIIANAYKLSVNTQVALRIASLKAAVAEKAFDVAALNKAWVLEKLAKVTELGMSAAVVKDDKGNPVLTEDGRAVTAGTENLSAANKALELIGKEGGMFVDRKEIRHGALEGLAHDELRALNEFLAGIPAGPAGDSAGRTTH